MNTNTGKPRNKILPRRAVLLPLWVLIASCATTAGDDRPPRQTTECPGSMMLICEGSNEPSSGGDDETPAYDRCYCRSRY